MGLKDRMSRAGVRTAELSDSLATPEPTRIPAKPDAFAQAIAGDASAQRVTPPLLEMKQRVHDTLCLRLGHRLYDTEVSENEMRSVVRGELASIIQNEAIPLTEGQHTRLVDELTADALGYGPLEDLLRDDTISEIMVLGNSPIFVERNGQLERSKAQFVSEQHLRRTIDRIVSGVGRRVDESSPMVDARLPDGSRINAVIPPLAVDGSMLTIRKFAQSPLTIEQLIASGTMSAGVANFLERSVKAHVTTLVSGGTGTGKTTMLNVLSGYIPEGERIVSIEDSVELRLRQDHVARMESRPPNVEGKGAVNIRDLVRNALRMRPDRIIVGEVRGGEAFDMLQAMNTGHEGSLTTLHANTPRDALSRLETMVLMAGMDLPHQAIREQVASAVSLIVQLSRLSDGTRRVTKISEVTGMEGQAIQMSDLYTFDWSAGVDATGRFRGSAKPTGLHPTFRDRLDLQCPTSKPSLDPRPPNPPTRPDNRRQGRKLLRRVLTEHKAAAL